MIENDFLGRYWKRLVSSSLLEKMESKLMKILWKRLIIKKRFALYRAFTYQQYRYLGKDNRIQLGSCVEYKIEELFPSEDNDYAGFDQVLNNN